MTLHKINWTKAGNATDVVRHLSCYLKLIEPNRTEIETETQNSTFSLSQGQVLKRYFSFWDIMQRNMNKNEILLLNPHIDPQEVY